MHKHKKTQLKDALISTLGEMAEFQPDVEIKAKVVIESALHELCTLPEDLPKLRLTASWTATQTLRSMGLIAPQNTRGMWALTEAGVERARNLAAPPQLQEPDPVSLEKPIEKKAISSQWAGEAIGISFHNKPLRDAYGFDGYIKSIGIGETPCFGSFRDQNRTCNTCPIAASCRSKQYLRLSVIAQSLQGNVVSETLPNIIQGVQSLDDIMNELEAAPVLSQIVIQIESICFLCYQVLPEGSTAYSVPKKGYKHLSCS